VVATRDKPFRSGRLDWVTAFVRDAAKWLEWFEQNVVFEVCVRRSALLTEQKVAILTLAPIIR